MYVFGIVNNLTGSYMDYFLSDTFIPDRAYLEYAVHYSRSPIDFDKFTYSLVALRFFDNGESLHVWNGSTPPDDLGHQLVTDDLCAYLCRRRASFVPYDLEACCYE